MRDSWTNSYEEVDYELPAFPKAASVPATLQETEHMLSLPPRPASFHDTPPLSSEPIPTPSRALHGRSKSQTTPPLPSTSSTSTLTEATNPLISNDSPTSPNLHRSSSAFVSSPLNPATSTATTSLTARPRPPSRMSANLRHMPSEESRAQSTAPVSMASAGQRGSMVLYRLADVHDDVFVPPALPHHDRSSMFSTSGDSFVSLSSDSRYPETGTFAERGLVQYAYDPEFDDLDPADEEDFLHDPKQKYISEPYKSWRGIANSATLIGLIVSIVILFILYPMLRFYRDNNRNVAIVMNTRINSSGQAVDLNPTDKRDQVPIVPHMLEARIDPSTPISEKTIVGLNSIIYELIFSDEFEVHGRSFYDGDDYFWEALDEDSYGSEQVTTQDGRLVVLQNFSPTGGRGTQFLSGMLRNRNLLCLGTGYVEIGFMLPGQSSLTRAFWSGAWTTKNPALFGSIQTVTQPLNLNLGILVPAPENQVKHAMESSISMFVEYVRVYQQGGQLSASCAKSYLSSGHVNATLDAYNFP